MWYGGGGSLQSSGLSLPEWSVPAGSRRYLGRTPEVQIAILAVRKVPVEIYEIYPHASVLKLLVLIINLAIVSYLIYLVRNRNLDLG